MEKTATHHQSFPGGWGWLVVVGDSWGWLVVIEVVGGGWW